MSSASTLIGRARVTLIDTANQTWSDNELLDYLIMGVNRACALLLDLYIDVVDHDLAPGMRQYLPEGALLLIDSTTNGAGQPVTQQAKTELARVQQTWANAAGGQPAFFMYDKRAPRTFQVWPPADSGASMELVVGAIPPAFGFSDELPISAWFETALWAFVCGMALAKNTNRQDLAKTAQFLAMFDADLAKWQAIKEANASPPDPTGVH